MYRRMVVTFCFQDQQLSFSSSFIQLYALAIRENWNLACIFCILIVDVYGKQDTN